MTVALHHFRSRFSNQLNLMSEKRARQGPRARKRERSLYLALQVTASTRERLLFLAVETMRLPKK